LNGISISSKKRQRQRKCRVIYLVLDDDSDLDSLIKERNSVKPLMKCDGVILHS